VEQQRWVAAVSDLQKGSETWIGLHRRQLTGERVEGAARSLLPLRRGCHDSTEVAARLVDLDDRAE
jgi:hypothetical protein